MLAHHIDNILPFFSLFAFVLHTMWYNDMDFEGVKRPNDAEHQTIYN